MNNLITVDPNVMGGTPCVRGTKVSVHSILALLADGYSEQQVVDAYDGYDIAREDIRACLAFAMRRVDRQPSVARTTKCYVCEEFDMYGMIMPYGSIFDGEFICQGCIEKYVDHAIEEANDAEAMKRSREREA